MVSQGQVGLQFGKCNWSKAAAAAAPFVAGLFLIQMRDKAAAALINAVQYVAYT